LENPIQRKPVYKGTSEEQGTVSEERFGSIKDNQISQIACTNQESIAYLLDLSCT
jgi:hypothetical protein